MTLLIIEKYYFNKYCESVLRMLSEFTFFPIYFRMVILFIWNKCKHFEQSCHSHRKNTPPPTKKTESGACGEFFQNNVGFTSWVSSWVSFVLISWFHAQQFYFSFTGINILLISHWIYFCDYKEILRVLGRHSWPLNCRGLFVRRAVR